MHVGIDVTSLIYGRGVSRYTANLVRALLRYTDVSVSVYGVSLRRYKNLLYLVDELEKEGRFKHRVLRHVPVELVERLWQMGLSPIRKHLKDIDLFHSWDWLQPPDKDLPLVSTIHDLAILKYPETAHPKVLKAHRRSWRVLKEKNAHIITPSNATKKDVIKYLDIAPRQVHVVYEALPEPLFVLARKLTEDDVLKVKEKFKLKKPFLLFVGTTEPRKNLKHLLQAWEPLKKDYDLVIAGAAGWDKLDKNIPGVKFLGPVSDLELAVLYTEAKVFVYPSLYEGFGLPILESFYFGTPVVTSNNSGMIEVAGNAAELVDPASSESIRTGILKILNETKDEEEVRRQRMIIRGQMFNLRQMGLETAKVYQVALADYEKSLLP